MHLPEQYGSLAHFRKVTRNHTFAIYFKLQHEPGNSQPISIPRHPHLCAVWPRRNILPAPYVLYHSVHTHASPDSNHFKGYATESTAPTAVTSSARTTAHTGPSRNVSRCPSRRLHVARSLRRSRGGHTDIREMPCLRRCVAAGRGRVPRAGKSPEYSIRA